MMARMVLPYDDQGSGRPVVLLHAGVADRSMWDDLLPGLAAAGLRAVAMDLPGFGDATVAAYPPWSAVLETMDALEIGRASLVGNSFGGAVALRAAVLAPERVERLALVSAPAPNLEPSAELQAAWEAEESALERGDLEGAVAAVIETWTRPDASPALRERVAAMQRRAFQLQTLAGDGEADDDPLEPDASGLAELAMPVLVAVGEFDMSDFHEGARTLARDLPHARSVVIPQAGHLAPLERPEEFRHLLLDHLREN
jgi:pimeloyl-ACP methyl ester carboxylesterase